MLFYDTKPRDIEATWWQGTPLRKVPFPAWVRKPLAVASKLGYSNFLCTCLGTQSMTKLNQSSLKPRRHSIQTFTLRKNTYARIWGLKQWEAFARRGHILGTYGTSTRWVTWHIAFVEFICYDDACHLKKKFFQQIRYSLVKYSRQTNLVIVDNMHMQAHTDQWYK